MHLPGPSKLTDTQKWALLSADNEGFLPGHAPRVTARSLRHRGLVRAVGTRVQLTANGRIVKAALEEQADTSPRSSR